MTSRKKNPHTRVVDGVVYEGRSVFDDLGFSAEETVQLISKGQKEISQRNAIKLAAVDAINSEIKQRHMNVTSAAQFLSISRPRLSNITNRKLEKFSIDNMVDILSKLGKTIQITVVDAVEAMGALPQSSHQTKPSAQAPAKAAKKHGQASIA